MTSSGYRERLLAECSGVRIPVLALLFGCQKTKFNGQRGRERSQPNTATSANG